MEAKREGKTENGGELSQLPFLFIIISMKCQPGQKGFQLPK